MGAQVYMRHRYIPDITVSKDNNTKGFTRSQTK